MRLHAIEAHNFLSLRDIHIDNLDQHLNFLVGPNGCGKTSVFRILRTIRDTFDSYWKGPIIDDLSDQCTRGIQPVEIELAIEVEFDQPEEQTLLVAFLCAALSNPGEMRNLTIERTSPPGAPNGNGAPLEPIPTTRPIDEGIRNFSEWLLTLFSPEKIPFLFRGDIRIIYRLGEVFPNLQLSYAFDCAGTKVTVVSGTSFSGSGQLYLGDHPELNPGGGYSLGYAWKNAFIQAPELKHIAELLSGQVITGPDSLSANNIMIALAKERVELNVRLEQPYTRAQKRLIELGNIRTDDLSRGVTFPRLISMLLHQALVFTNNQRAPLKRYFRFTWEDIISQPIHLDDEAMVPLWLYHLKNGTYLERQRFQNIQGVFKQIVGGNQSFDIEVTPTSKGQEEGFWMDLRVVDDGGDMSLAYQGAGIWEALLLSTLLETSAGRIILLDEPAANLHPGMQRKLLELLRKTKGQVIAVTHSPHLIPTRPNDFLHVIRLQKESDGTLAYRLVDPAKKRIRSDKLEQELSSSSEVAGLLFANAIILIEGDTETAALSEWFPTSKAGKNRIFADLNIALFAVGGKMAFPFYIRFLTAFGVSWVVICDGDALTVNNGIWGVLKELGRIKADPPANAPFSDLKAQADRVGVFTANADFTESFEKIPEVKHYMDDPKNGLPTKSKARDGRLIGQNVPCPLEIERILHNALEYLAMK